MQANERAVKISGGPTITDHYKRSYLRLATDSGDSPVISRPKRADAQRNRERLLEVAVQAFSHDGADAPLEAIAREAGVGIGTLYRHFPTREALVEAAYRKELARLCEAAPDLLRELPPDQAMRRWMDHFVI